MQILHINTWDSGGAANAAKRLYRAQKYNGLDVRFLSLKCSINGEDDIDHYEAYLIKKFGSFLTRLIIFANRSITN